LEATPGWRDIGGEAAMSQEFGAAVEAELAEPTLGGNPMEPDGNWDPVAGLCSAAKRKLSTQQDLPIQPFSG